MLVLMNVQATPDQISNVLRHIRERGFEPIELPGIDRLAIGVLGATRARFATPSATSPVSSTRSR